MAQDQAQTQNILLRLTNDAVFKLYFTRKENIQLLKQFIKATTHLTDDDLETIEIKNPILTKEHVGEKDFIVDICITTKNGRQINIELQVQNHSGFIERIVGYNARQYSSQLKRGQDYTEINETISLVVVDFKLFKDCDDFSEHICFRRENGKVFTGAQQFYIIDLTKLPKELTHTQHQWGALFKAKTEEELMMLMESSEEMRVAGEQLLKLSANEEARQIAEAREMSQWAWQHTLRATEQKAEQKGRDEERAQAEAEKSELVAQAEAEKLEIARNLFSAFQPLAGRVLFYRGLHDRRNFKY